MSAAKCGVCGSVHAPPAPELPIPTHAVESSHQMAACLAGALVRITTLLKAAADEGICSGCLAPVWWLQHKNGKRTPYTAEGLNHFIDCPVAGRFKKR